MYLISDASMIAFLTFSHLVYIYLVIFFFFIFLSNLVSGVLFNPLYFILY
jgi:hypothetical protein